MPKPGNDRAKRLAEEIREGEKALREKQKQNRDTLNEGTERKKD